MFWSLLSLPKESDTFFSPLVPGVAARTVLSFVSSVELANILVGLRTTGSMKATIVTPIVGAIAWAALCYRNGENKGEQESETDHSVAVMTGLSILGARPPSNQFLISK